MPNRKMRHMIYSVFIRPVSMAVSTGFHFHLIGDMSAYQLSWQCINEEKEGSSFIRMKPGQLAYLDDETRMKPR
jgi:hypothetical protein